MFVLSGNGYCRSEAAVAVLLTKRPAARRVYATVINAGNNTDGYKEQGKEVQGSTGSHGRSEKWFRLLVFCDVLTQG